MLARELGRRLGLPVVHLDRVFWRPGWVEPPRDEWERLHREALAGDAWIADGNYGSTMRDRLRWADTIVLIDPSPAVCLWRVFRRQLRWLGRVRDDLPPGCPERLDARATMAFWRYIWAYRRTRLPRVLALIEEVQAGRRVEILRSNGEVQGFLESIGRESRR